MIRNGAKVYENPADYDAMAEVMWCGSLSHNNLTECGRGKDFSVHNLGHALSARYDVAHGASLGGMGIWAEYLYQDQALGRFVQFAKNVWGISGEGKSEQETALTGIEKNGGIFPEHRHAGQPFPAWRTAWEQERMELSLTLLRAILEADQNPSPWRKRGE